MAGPTVPNAPTEPSIFGPGDTDQSFFQSLTSIKQNLEAHHNFKKGRPNTAPTTVNKQLAAAISAVTP